MSLLHFDSWPYVRGWHLQEMHRLWYCVAVLHFAFPLQTFRHLLNLIVILITYNPGFTCFKCVLFHFVDAAFSGVQEPSYMQRPPPHLRTLGVLPSLIVACRFKHSERNDFFFIFFRGRWSRKSEGCSRSKVFQFYACNGASIAAESHKFFH